jgi:hypothetical protein
MRVIMPSTLTFPVELNAAALWCEAAITEYSSIDASVRVALQNTRRRSMAKVLPGVDILAASGTNSGMPAFPAS